MVTPAEGNGQTGALSAAASRPLSGAELREALRAAALHLREQAAAVDAINVYPVPDGDTGSNMAATLSEAVGATAELGEAPGAAAVFEKLARGALFAARGNSGVILSQALRGFAASLDGEALDARGMAVGLEAAAAAAYRAVARPMEGTMLTVLRRAGEAARAAAAALPGEGAGLPCLSVLRAAVAAAEAAEAVTIDQLPALHEAGVTDAGGEGVCVILRGLLAWFEGRAPVAPALPGALPRLHSATEEDGFGFCTEFMLEASPGASLDEGGLRELAGRAPNTSLVIVGDASALRVHVHTDSPEELLREVEALGQLSRVKVDDMSAQHRRFAEEGSGATAKAGLLAVSSGSGWDAVFEGLGASVLDLGEIVKPAAGDIARAADALRRADVIVLPNHKNVQLAAQQAREIARSTLHIVPSTSMPQGVAAAIAFDPEAPVAENVAAMTGALTSVRTVEVTVAAADRTADGVSVRAGQAIALLDGALVLAAEDTTTALMQGLERAGAATAGLVTVYPGAGATTDAELRRVLAQAFPGVALEFIGGGQPLYAYIASVEE